MYARRNGFDLLNTQTEYEYEQVHDDESVYQDEVITPLVSEVKLELSRHRPVNPRTFLCGYLGNDNLYVDMMVFDQCVYFASAISAAMFILWIGWMPLLHVSCLPLSLHTSSHLTNV